jgi:hypothetical protein
MAVTTDLPQFPTLRMLKAAQDTLPTIGLPKLELPDGTVLDVPTMGAWTVSTEYDGVATLTLRIPVRLDVETE